MLENEEESAPYLQPHILRHWLKKEKTMYTKHAQTFSFSDSLRQTAANSASSFHSLRNLSSMGAHSCGVDGCTPGIPAPEKPR